MFLQRCIEVTILNYCYKKLVVLSNFFIRKDKNNTFNYGQDIPLHKREIVFSNISAKVAWCHNISF